MSDGGVAEVSDFMPVAEMGNPHTLIRRAMTIRGEVTFRMECAPRFDYGELDIELSKRLARCCSLQMVQMGPLCACGVQYHSALTMAAFAHNSG